MSGYGKKKNWSREEKEIPLTQNSKKACDKSSNARSKKKEAPQITGKPSTESLAECTLDKWCSIVYTLAYHEICCD